MASNLKLLRVVAFDGSGKPVLGPVQKWKLSYSQRRATLEIKYAGYSRTYDLRTDLVSVAPMDSRQKASIGKTLGRVALTGLVHGRRGAAADLRWGGLDRDEVTTLALIFGDTTSVSVEMESDEVDELLTLVPETVASNEAFEVARGLVHLIKAMADDGPRVLQELETKHVQLEEELVTLRPTIDGGASFDERQAARERGLAIEAELAELQITRQGVLYALAYNGTDVTQAVERTVMMPPAATASNVISDSAAQDVKASKRPTTSAQRASSSTGPGGSSKLVKVLVFVFGAFVGCLAALLSMLFLGPLGVFLSPITVIGSGWLAVKMFNSWMRR